jgi:hypothetical protein
MKPQVTIEETSSGFIINKEEEGNTEQVEAAFDSYQAALDFILDQGWQLKRERPDNSLHVETRFLKP